ncbi:hypothetical protein DRJ22_06045 [Candidatus Woesearchaeota archaeon]|nr:MAG: hypothetical protein DRJ22_06045 [Candidatus Woesearchaeota archaeon]
MKFKVTLVLFIVFILLTSCVSRFNQVGFTVTKPDDVIDMKNPKPQTDENIPKKTVTEGELISFSSLKAVDPDGDPIEYSFTAPLNSKGEWLTKEGDAGEYRVTITASDGENTVSQDVLIIVKPKNRPPVINIADTVSVKEGETVRLDPKITDLDGDKVDVSYSGWMDKSTKVTGFDDAGSYKVVISASDGKVTSEKEVIVNVLNTNRKPELEVPEQMEVNEGAFVKITPKTSDPDGDDVTVTFSEPLNEEGTWQTKIGDDGVYNIKVTASDGGLKEIKTVKLVVKSLNKAPVIEIASIIVAQEGDTLTLEPEITDLEGDKFTVSYSGWMTSDTKKIGYDDAGEYDVTITAKDEKGHSSSKTIKVIVENKNRPPKFVFK